MLEIITLEIKINQNGCYRKNKIYSFLFYVYS